jgi:hypothetical protein
MKRRRKGQRQGVTLVQTEDAQEDEDADKEEEEECWKMRR